MELHEKTGVVIAHNGPRVMVKADNPAACCAHPDCLAAPVATFEARVKFSPEAYPVGSHVRAARRRGDGWGGMMILGTVKD